MFIHHCLYWCVLSVMSVIGIVRTNLMWYMERSAKDIQKVKELWSTGQAVTDVKHTSISVMAEVQLAERVFWLSSWAEVHNLFTTAGVRVLNRKLSLKSLTCVPFGANLAKSKDKCDIPGELYQELRKVKF